MTANYEQCRKCGADLSEDNIMENLWYKPYCPACWPSECPNCGETRHYFWSLVNERLECDQGCHLQNNNLADV